MSQENIEIVRRMQPTEVDLVEVFRSDAAADALTADADVGAMSPDAVIEFVGGENAMARGEYRGLKGLVEGWRDWLEGWDSHVLRLEDLVDAGDQVVALVRISGRTTRHGVEVEHAPAAVWTIENGTVVGISFYLDRDQAFEAAGLSDQKNDSG
jgi:ketosteroid isomerase-like protein